MLELCWIIWFPIESNSNISNVIFKCFKYTTNALPWPVPQHSKQIKTVCFIHKWASTSKWKVKVSVLSNYVNLSKNQFKPSLLLSVCTAESLALMLWKFKPIRVDLTLKYWTVAQAHYCVCEWTNSSPVNTFHLQYDFYRKIYPYYHWEVYCRGLYTLLHAANTTSSSTSTDAERHHFKHGGLTICDLHQLPWQSVHRATYLTQSILAVLPLSTFCRGTTSYSFCGEERRACRTHHSLSAHPPSILSTWSQLLI